MVDLVFKLAGGIGLFLLGMVLLTDGLKAFAGEARLDDPGKNWKFAASDLETRRDWVAFQRACEECLRATGATAAPWFGVPADDKWKARLIISQIILSVLSDLPLRSPAVPVSRRRELARIGHELLREK